MIIYIYVCVCVCVCVCVYLLVCMYVPGVAIIKELPQQGQLAVVNDNLKTKCIGQLAIAILPHQGYVSHFAENNLWELMSNGIRRTQSQT